MIKSKMRFAMLAGLFWPAFFMLSAQKTVSIDDCIRMSLENNLQVKNAAIDLNSVELRIKEAKSGFLPNVDVGGQLQYYITMPKILVPAEAFGGPAGTYTEFSMGSEQSTNASLQVSQVLYNQKVFIGLKAAKTALNLTDLQMAMTKEQLVSNVCAVYYNLQMLQSNLASVDSNVVLLEKIFTINKTLQSNELISKTNLKRLEIGVENLKNEQRNLLLTTQKTYSLLKYLLQIPLEEDLKVEPLQETPMKIINLASFNRVDSRNDLLLSKEQIQLAELNKKATQAEYYPSLAAVYNYGISGYYNKLSPFKSINDKWFNSSYIGVQLNIPVFSGLSRYHRVRQLDNAVKKAKNNYDLLYQSAEKSLSDAKMNIQTSLNAYESASRNFDLAKSVFHNAVTEYQSGILSLTDVLQIQNELTMARNTFTTSLVQMKQAEIELKLAVGKLIEVE